MLGRGKMVLIGLLTGMLVFGEIGIHAANPAGCIGTGMVNTRDERGDRAFGMSDRAEIERVRYEISVRREEQLAEADDEESF